VLGLSAEQDKSGAASAALRKAADEISKVESAQLAVVSFLDFPTVDVETQQAVAEGIARAVSLIGATVEADDKRAKAKEGLARMIDGLRQLQGMLRQARLSSRILDQIDAAINGLKMTRDNVDSMKTEAVTTNWKDVPYDWKKVQASEVKKGQWLKGGGAYDATYRQVMDLASDGSGVTFTFDNDYIGADGVRRNTARFANDAMVQVGNTPSSSLRPTSKG